MKYSEFEKLMEDKGLVVDRVPGGNLRVRIFDNNFWTTLATVNIRTPNSYSVMPISDYPEKLVRFVAQNCMELSFTDLGDRKEEEKYYYRLKGFNTLIDKYLARGKISHSFYLVSQYEKEDYNTQFTDKYFETFPEDIKSHNWEKIKVERED